MVNSKAKGANGEREAAAIIGGTKISRSGQPGPDLCDCSSGTCIVPEKPTNSNPEIHFGRFVEVKRPKTLPKQITQYLDQMDEEGADYLLVRQDRGRWIRIEYVN